EMPYISEESYKSLHNSLQSHKLYLMTLGHRLILDRMYADKAIGSIVISDSIYANNALSSAYQAIVEGKSAVLVFCPRFASLALLSALRTPEYVQANSVLSIGPRALIQLAQHHVHIDMLMQQWDSPILPEFMLEPHWALPNQNGFIFHTWSCWYAFINYEKLSSHDLKSLGDNTVDGVYLGANLKKEAVHFITDSDDFTLISFSADIHRALKPMSLGRVLPKKIQNLLKIAFAKQTIKNMMYRQIEPFKLEFAMQPIYLHTENLTPECHALAITTQRTIKKILDDKFTVFEKAILAMNDMGKVKAKIGHVMRKVKRPLKLTAIFSAGFFSGAIIVLKMLHRLVIILK
ncbi:MAG: hypothetical protein Q8L68_06140, partial [Methylococcales bacterium]|nr:hypothetical protein [Methylococcales bacterium]